MFKEIALNNKKLTFVTWGTLLLFACCKLVVSEVIRIDLQVVEKSVSLKYSMLVIINILVLFFIVFADYISIRYSEKFLTYSKYFLNKKLFSSIVSNGKSINIDVDSMELISKFNNDIPVIIDEYISVIISISYFIFSCILGIIYISGINIYLAIYIILISLLTLFLTKYLTRKLSVIQKRFNTSLTDINSLINNMIKNFTLFKVFNKINVLHNKFNKVNSKHRETNYKMKMTSRYSDIVSDLGGAIITCGLYLFGIFLIEKSILNFSDLVATVQASSMITVPIAWISSTITSLSKSKILREEFNEYVNRNAANLSKKTEVKSIESIDFRNLTVNYDDVNIIDNMNLTLYSGKKYASIGKSGSGKSTLLKTILSLTSLHNGEIIINNCNNIEESSIYNLISYIGQENFILKDSIKNNITMYSDYDEGKMNEIIKLLSLDDLISQKGLDYILDENSTQISGGEKQRINIARALYKESDFIIIDEGFSSLDMKQSKQIEEYILNRYNTVISVMHKFNDETFKRYDFVVNFDNIPLRANKIK